MGPSTTGPVHGAPAMKTSAPDSNPVPSRASEVPPAAGPVAGSMDATVTGSRNANAVGRAASPSGVLTSTITAPGACGGVTTVTMVCDGSTVTTAASAPPKRTVGAAPSP